MAVASKSRERDIVYPEERLPWPQTILLGGQHVLAMFGATVLVPGTIRSLAAAIASVYLRGFPRLLPVLIGVVVGYLVAGLDQAAGGACASAASGCHVNTSGIATADWLGYPKLAFPDFSDPVRAFSLFWFIPIVLVAENTGHVFAIGGSLKGGPTCLA